VFDSRDDFNALADKLENSGPDDRVALFSRLAFRSWRRQVDILDIFADAQHLGEQVDDAA
jgi:hypothetical protein